MKSQTLKYTPGKDERVRGIFEDLKDYEAIATFAIEFYLKPFAEVYLFVVTNNALPITDGYSFFDQFFHNAYAFNKRHKYDKRLKYLEVSQIGFHHFRRQFAGKGKWPKADKRLFGWENPCGPDIEDYNQIQQFVTSMREAISKQQYRILIPERHGAEVRKILNL